VSDILAGYSDQYVKRFGLGQRAERRWAKPTQPMSPGRIIPCATRGYSVSLRPLCLCG